MRFNRGLPAMCLLACASLAAAQDPTKTLPHNYWITFENPVVQVIHVRYEAHQKLPVHDHSENPTVYVYLTDSGPIRLSHSEARPFTLIRQPLKMGTFRVSPGRIERHEIENLGDIPSEFLRVELKTLPIGVSQLEFRGNQPFDLSRTAVTIEFASPRLSIQRIVCTVNTASEPIPPGNPSLLIAFSPLLLHASAADSKRMNPGDVYWLDAQQTASLAPSGPAPAHALRILFPYR
jgi:hypothetical protein